MKMLSHGLHHNFRHVVRATSGRTWLSTRALRNCDEEYAVQPKYPKIEDPSFTAKKQREAVQWHDKIRQLSTVEEKLFEINMPKYYGYKAHMITDEKFPYNVLPFAQFATRTHLSEGKLPEYYDTFNESARMFLDTMKTDLEDIIGFELSGYRRASLSTDNVPSKNREEIVTAALLSGLNRILVNRISEQYGYLNEVELDFDPRHEAFWFLGGIPPPSLVKKIREGVEWQKTFADDPYDRKIQYVGKPYLAVRHRNPLDPISPDNLDTLDLKADQVEIPAFKYDPITLGYRTEQRHATTIPGFWPGDQHEFGLVSYQRRSHSQLRHTYCTVDDLQEALHSQGIFSSFAWLFGQACYQGFSTFNDLTYPLSTQTVITDGKNWSFYVYQLNTTLVHSNQVDLNPRYNRCWGTKQLQLFEHVDESGKIHGLNEEVLLNLISFYCNAPKVREGVDLKPYLCQTETRVANILDEKRRVFMEQTYKHRSSNRSRHRPDPELYSWEKLYKVDNNTRPTEPKRRPFELGQNMYKRRMDEHALKYIPRQVRPDGPKSKPKFEVTYYPSVRR
ncbi:28S ribosomal protein S30, mitochondrial [Toxorhynchites rutilus septentrionalis]|uniref:28S ribosomal protein S30, mitochondrial n=1 Tax=Toxorhynchites rutilus septentrionalis TaxID=329112 RepID=UPI0024786E0E|nr:28S ribosomal protein S30, mitochondrial [Toxorhynchites rutilus septentrionalis]